MNDADKILKRDIEHFNARLNAEQDARRREAVGERLAPQYDPADVAFNRRPTDTDSVLDQRGKNYGEFKDGAAIMQTLKAELRSLDGWQRLSYAQREALEMIVHKMGRILNGDPNYADSWTDIAGYARLIERELMK